MQSLARPSIAQFSAVVRNVTREALSRAALREALRDIPWRRVLADIGLLILFALACSILRNP